MREIKFRGKDKANQKKWEYGGGISTARDDGATFIINVGKDFIGHMAFLREVDPNTVGQYTGLHDKNGNEIYEGDILKIFISIIPNNKPFYGFVGYNKSSFCLFDKYGIRRAKFDTINEEEMEVIGNIYDNPELLEGDKE